MSLEITTIIGTAIGILLAFCIGGLLDRLRGDFNPEGWGGAKKFILGGFLGLATGFLGWELLLAAILFATSFANGWGSPLGACLGKHNNMEDPEKWQIFFGKWIKPLLTNAKAALAFRGLIAAVYILPLMWFNINIAWLLVLLPICYLIPTQVTGNWEKYEMLRGGLIAISCILISVI